MSVFWLICYSMKEHALPALPVLPVTKTNHAREREGQSPDSSKKNGESLPPLLLIRRTQKRGKFKSIRSEEYGKFTATNGRG